MLISLVAVMMGDALWGIPGMFLAIPLVAIVKLIFDRIGALESWGYLLGTPTVNNEAGTGFTINRFLNYINIKFSKNEN